MKILQRVLAIATMGVIMCGGTANISLAAGNNPFPDVSSEYWGAGAIQWAYDNKIVDGYPDGSFKPEQKVSQSEFVAMLIRAYQPADFFKEENAEWDFAYNRYAYMNNWIELGWKIGDPPLDPSVISRGKVAKILTHVNGRNYNVNDSIQFLLDIGLSQGKIDRSLLGYHKDDMLTRSEAVTFIQNIKTKLDILYRSPAAEETYANSTLFLTPAENWKLVVAQGLEGPEYVYSILSFESPSQGYTKDNQATFTIQAKLLQDRGKGLTIHIDKKRENGFVRVNTEETLFTNTEINKSIDLNGGTGLYRITINTEANVNHREGNKEITMFYVDYQPNSVPTLTTK